MAILGLFFLYLPSLQTNNTILTTNRYEKCPSSICCGDSNPWPLEHESSPITTMPELPPLNHHTVRVRPFLFLNWAVEECRWLALAWKSLLIDDYLSDPRCESHSSIDHFALNISKSQNSCLRLWPLLFNQQIFEYLSLRAKRRGLARFYCGHMW